MGHHFMVLPQGGSLYFSVFPPFHVFPPDIHNNFDDNTGLQKDDTVNMLNKWSKIYYTYVSDTLTLLEPITCRCYFTHVFNYLPLFRGKLLEMSFTIDQLTFCHYQHRQSTKCETESFKLW